MEKESKKWRGGGNSLFQTPFWFGGKKQSRKQAQNELLVRKHLKPGDAYVHADVHGAASVILKNHRKVPSSSYAAAAPARASPSRPPLPALSLAQAGACAVCRSSAWSSKVVARAWWVEAAQVSKQPPTGEYLTQVRGREFFFFSGKVSGSAKRNTERKKTPLSQPPQSFLFSQKHKQTPPPREPL